MKDFYYRIVYYLNYLRYLKDNKEAFKALGYKTTKFGLIYKTIIIPSNIRNFNKEISVDEIFIFEEYQKFFNKFSDIADYIEYETILIDPDRKIYEIQLKFNEFDIDKFASNFIIFSLIFLSLLSGFIYIKFF